MKQEIQNKLKMEKTISFGEKKKQETTQEASKINGSFLTSEESKIQISMAKNVQSSTNEDVSDSTSYRDDAFESSYNKSESFGNYDASFASSKLSDSRTFKLPKSGEPMDEDDMLLQESKHLHNKLKA